MTGKSFSTSESEKYTSETVQVLDHVAHIRKRPSMYIGWTNAKGLYYLACELISNSLDEALAGYGKTIHTTIHPDGSLSVADDGRGIPVDMHPELQRSILEIVFTIYGSGVKFDKSNYKVSGVLPGSGGAKVVSALSEWTEARVFRNGRGYSQLYERGVAMSDVADLGAVGNRTGTTVRFKPDLEIFHDASFDYDTLESRMRELAFLNKGLTFRLTDERSGKDEVFEYEGGICDLVTSLNRNEETLHRAPIYMDKTVDNIRVEAAIQFTTSAEERIQCYASNAYTPVGGTHLSGFRTALIRTLNVTHDEGESWEGLTAVVSVQHPNPQFVSATKTRLGNPEVEGIVAGVVSEYLSKFMEENPKDAARIMKKWRATTVCNLECSRNGIEQKDTTECD